MQTTTTPTDAPPITWEIDLPLLRGSEVVGSLAKVFGISGAIMAAFLSVLLLATGSPEAIPAVVAGSAVLAGIFFLLGVMASAVVFRGRMRMRYTVDGEGVRADVIDRRVKAVNRVALVAGVLSGRPSMAATGQIAIDQETEALAWTGAFRAVGDPRRCTVAFANGWRTLLVIHVDPELFLPVADRVRTEMATAGTTARAGRRGSPLPRMLLVTGVAVAASLLLFPLADAFDVDLFLPTVQLAFAVAMIWLVSLFGWVVLACLLVLLGGIVLSLVEVHDSILFAGETYRGFDVLSGDDIALLVLGAGAAAVLGWLAVRALRGRLPSMLERDMEDEGA